MVRELLEVVLLLPELLSEGDELLLLALADGKVLLGLLAALEGITVSFTMLADYVFFPGFCD